MKLQIIWGEWTIFTRLSYIYPIKQGCFPITMILINNNFVSGKKKKTYVIKTRLFLKCTISLVCICSMYFLFLFSFLLFFSPTFGMCAYMYMKIYGFWCCELQNPWANLSYSEVPLGDLLRVLGSYMIRAAPLKKYHVSTFLSCVYNHFRFLVLGEKTKLKGIVKLMTTSLQDDNQATHLCNWDWR